MKKLLIIAMAIGTLSCGSTKESTDDIATKEQTQTKPAEGISTQVDGAVNGTIKDMRFKDGCDFVISVMLDNKVVLLEPGMLDNKYKVDGKAVQLIYTPSRRQSKCTGTMPITIEKIK